MVVAGHRRSFSRRASVGQSTNGEEDEPSSDVGVSGGVGGGGGGVGSDGKSEAASVNTLAAFLVDSRHEVLDAPGLQLSEISNRAPADQQSSSSIEALNQFIYQAGKIYHGTNKLTSTEESKLRAAAAHVGLSMAVVDALLEQKADSNAVIKYCMNSDDALARKIKDDPYLSNVLSKGGYLKTAGSSFNLADSVWRILMLKIVQHFLKEHNMNLSDVLKKSSLTSRLYHEAIESEYKNTHGTQVDSSVLRMLRDYTEERKNLVIPKSEAAAARQKASSMADFQPINQYPEENLMAVSQAHEERLLRESRNDDFQSMQTDTNYDDLRLSLSDYSYQVGRRNEVESKSDLPNATASASITTSKNKPMNQAPTKRTKNKVSAVKRGLAMFENAGKVNMVQSGRNSVGAEKQGVEASVGQNHAFKPPALVQNKLKPDLRPSVSSHVENTHHSDANYATATPVVAASNKTILDSPRTFKNTSGRTQKLTEVTAPAINNTLPQQQRSPSVVRQRSNKSPRHRSRAEFAAFNSKHTPRSKAGKKSNSSQKKEKLLGRHSRSEGMSNSNSDLGENDEGIELQTKPLHESLATVQSEANQQLASKSPRMTTQQKLTAVATTTTTKARDSSAPLPDTNNAKRTSAKGPRGSMVIAAMKVFEKNDEYDTLKKDSNQMKPLEIVEFEEDDDDDDDGNNDTAEKGKGKENVSPKSAVVMGQPRSEDIRSGAPAQKPYPPESIDIEMDNVSTRWVGDDETRMQPHQRERRTGSRINHIFSTEELKDDPHIDAHNVEQSTHKRPERSRQNEKEGTEGGTLEIDAPTSIGITEAKQDGLIQGRLPSENLLKDQLPSDGGDSDQEQEPDYENRAAPSENHGIKLFSDVAQKPKGGAYITGSDNFGEMHHDVKCGFRTSGDQRRTPNNASISRTTPKLVGTDQSEWIPFKSNSAWRQSASAQDSNGIIERQTNTEALDVGGSVREPDDSEIEREETGETGKDAHVFTAAMREIRECSEESMAVSNQHLPSNHEASITPKSTVNPKPLPRKQAPAAYEDEKVDHFLTHDPTKKDIEAAQDAQHAESAKYDRDRDYCPKSIPQQSLTQNNLDAVLPFSDRSSIPPPSGQHGGHADSSSNQDPERSAQSQGEAITDERINDIIDETIFQSGFGSRAGEDGFETVQGPHSSRAIQDSRQIQVQAPLDQCLADDEHICSPDNGISKQGDTQEREQSANTNHVGYDMDSPSELGPGPKQYVAIQGRSQTRGKPRLDQYLADDEKKHGEIENRRQSTNIDHVGYERDILQFELGPDPKLHFHHDISHATPRTPGPNVWKNGEKDDFRDIEAQSRQHNRHDSNEHDALATDSLRSKLVQSTGQQSEGRFPAQYSNPNEVRVTSRPSEITNLEGYDIGDDRHARVQPRQHSRYDTYGTAISNTSSIAQHSAITQTNREEFERETQERARADTDTACTQAEPNSFKPQSYENHTNHQQQQHIMASEERGRPRAGTHKDYFMEPSSQSYDSAWDPQSKSTFNWSASEGDTHSGVSDMQEVVSQQHGFFEQLTGKKNGKQAQHFAPPPRQIAMENVRPAMNSGQLSEHPQSRREEKSYYSQKSQAVVGLSIHAHDQRSGRANYTMHPANHSESVQGMNIVPSAPDDNRTVRPSRLRSKSQRPLTTEARSSYSMRRNESDFTRSPGRLQGEFGSHFDAGRNEFQQLRSPTGPERVNRQEPIREGESRYQSGPVITQKASEFRNESDVVTAQERTQAEVGSHFDAGRNEFQQLRSPAGPKRLYSKGPSHDGDDGGHRSGPIMTQKASKFRNESDFAPAQEIMQAEVGSHFDASRNEFQQLRSPAGPERVNHQEPLRDGGGGGYQHALMTTHKATEFRRKTRDRGIRNNQREHPHCIDNFQKAHMDGFDEIVMARSKNDTFEHLPQYSKNHHHPMRYSNEEHRVPQVSNDGRKLHQQMRQIAPLLSDKRTMEYREYSKYYNTVQTQQQQELAERSETQTTVPATDSESSSQDWHFGHWVVETDESRSIKRQRTDEFSHTTSANTSRSDSMALNPLEQGDRLDPDRDDAFYHEGHIDDRLQPHHRRQQQHQQQQQVGQCIGYHQPRNCQNPMVQPAEDKGEDHPMYTVRNETIRAGVYCVNTVQTAATSHQQACAAPKRSESIPLHEVRGQNAYSGCIDLISTPKINPGTPGSITWGGATTATGTHDNTPLHRPKKTQVERRPLSDDINKDVRDSVERARGSFISPQHRQAQSANNRDGDHSISAQNDAWEGAQPQFKDQDPVMSSPTWNKESGRGRVDATRDMARQLPHGECASILKIDTSSVDEDHDAINTIIGNVNNHGSHDCHDDDDYSYENDANDNDGGGGRMENGSFYSAIDIVQSNSTIDEDELRETARLNGIPNTVVEIVLAQARKSAGNRHAPAPAPATTDIHAETRTAQARNLSTQATELGFSGMHQSAQQVGSRSRTSNQNGRPYNPMSVSDPSPRNYAYNGNSQEPDGQQSWDSGGMQRPDSMAHGDGQRYYNDNDPLAGRDPSPMAKTVDSLDDVPEGATAEELKLLNRFIEVAANNFDGKELSSKSESAVRSAATKIGLSDILIDQLLDQARENNQKNRYSSETPRTLGDCTEARDSPEVRTGVACQFWEGVTQQLAGLPNPFSCNDDGASHASGETYD